MFKTGDIVCNGLYLYRVHTVNLYARRLTIDESPYEHPMDIFFIPTRKQLLRCIHTALTRIYNGEYISEALILAIHQILRDES